MKLAMENQDFLLFRNFFSAAFGLSLNNHTSETLSKKLSPRITSLGMKSFRAYYDYLSATPFPANELHELPSLIMNNESYFFREYPQLALLPELLKSLRREKPKKPSLPVRILSAGCASGEEPYSIAMIIDHLAGPLSTRHFYILGIDINQQALSTARQGIYSSYSFRGSNNSLFDKYFRKIDKDHCSIDKRISRNVELMQGNILDISFAGKAGPFDFIFCRNLLIYMTKSAQDRIVDNLRNALRDEGHLFVGQSESLKKQTPFFRTVKYPGVTVYRKIKYDAQAE